MNHVVQRRTWRLVLVPSLLLSIACSLGIMVIAAFAWGTDSGYFAGDHDRGTGTVLLAFAALLATVPLVLVPWAVMWRTRIVSACIFLAAYVVLVYFWIVSVTGSP
jgi:nitrogen fixation-related uncharacterized protein